LAVTTRGSALAGWAGGAGLQQGGWARLSTIDNEAIGGGFTKFALLRPCLFKLTRVRRGDARVALAALDRGFFFPSYMAVGPSRPSSLVGGRRQRPLMAKLGRRGLGYRHGSQLGNAGASLPRVGWLRVSKRHSVRSVCGQRPPKRWSLRLARRLRRFFRRRAGLASRVARPKPSWWRRRLALGGRRRQGRGALFRSWPRNLIRLYGRGRVQKRRAGPVSEGAGVKIDKVALAQALSRNLSQGRRGRRAYKVLGLRRRHGFGMVGGRRVGYRRRAPMRLRLGRTWAPRLRAFVGFRGAPRLSVVSLGVGIANTHGRRGRGVEHPTASRLWRERQFRMRPGYARLWRHYRQGLRVLLGLPQCMGRQYRLTKFLIGLGRFRGPCARGCWPLVLGGRVRSQPGDVIYSNELRTFRGLRQGRLPGGALEFDWFSGRGVVVGSSLRGEGAGGERLPLLTLRLYN
jgi:hypothetical protein